MSLRERLADCMEYMELGGSIRLDSGHKLEWSDEHEAPGFWAEKTNGLTGEKSEVIMQIGSEVAWMSLISHARGLSFGEAQRMRADIALTHINRKKRT